ncbi:DJ-1/PfpI family protein [Actinokineospora iranica]|uniref:DJ-1/PfpI family protein n=1 Tax=Actinokineospora iranica TaxID=1271860 RepID=A0A1G6XQH5_9PSEU|nr:DJ-1/PfpI family protein [Actinokineospora iranica]SDD80400.1 DJ-1/PfpI family protein [Actinokineospora iranica]
MRIVIPLYPGFTALDAVGPYEVLRLMPDAEVVFASAHPGPVRADSQVLEITADAALDDIDSCDILVVPGGPEARTPPEHLVRWLAAVHPTTLWTTSVCTGALILCAADILYEGLDATTHWVAAQQLRKYGVRYLPDRVVFQERHRIITSAGVSAGIDMALALVARVTDQVTAEAIQLIVQYDPQPPFHAGSPTTASDAARERAREILDTLPPVPSDIPPPRHEEPLTVRTRQGRRLREFLRREQRT